MVNLRMYIFIHSHLYIYVNICVYRHTSVLVLAFISTFFFFLSFNHKSYTRRFELMCCLGGAFPRCFGTVVSPVRRRPTMAGIFQPGVRTFKTGVREVIYIVCEFLSTARVL